MATAGSEDEEELISKGLYRLVSDIIGPEVELNIRRERLNMRDWMANNQCQNFVTVLSGSMAEGFEMKTSDMDIMFWSRDTVVVDNYSQVINYHPHYKTVLMIDYDYTSPGFALVKCITRDGSDHDIARSCVWKCSEYWVSSKKFVEYYLQSDPSATAHGPCLSGEMLGEEYDSAQCLKCAFWPQQASSVISRMRRCGWPPEDVIQEIINDGCLLVPVASKRPLFEGASSLEWRLSFSLAEKRLMHSMNHCQFLCYGLWKLFLSEVFKKLDGIQDLLCSYFLKTVVFWEISRDASSWTPVNFISKFHQTLRLLADFVNAGSCPNFFIPDNNMFYGKVFGDGQKSLMSYIRSFINEGFLCLLKCESLQSKFLFVISNPLSVLNISIDEAAYISSSLLRARHLSYILVCKPPLGDVKNCVNELCKMATAIIDSEFSSSVLDIRKRRLLQNIAERTLCEMSQSTTDNKDKHKHFKFAINILRRNRSYFGYRELLFAKTFHLLGNYKKSVQYANIVKTKLQDENTMYDWAITEERVNRIQTRDLTYPQVIQQNVAVEFEMYVETSLHELYPEIQALMESIGVPDLYIPPLVLAYFLLILSHHKTNDMIEAFDVLRELQVLVHHDDNFHIKYTVRAISWEILGMCEQLCGEYQAAYVSYINALNDRYIYFTNATIARINSLNLH